METGIKLYLIIINTEGFISKKEDIQRVVKLMLKNIDHSSGKVRE